MTELLKKQIKNKFVEDFMKEACEKLYDNLNAQERVFFVAMMLKKMRMRSQIPKSKVIEIIQELL